MLPAIVVVYLLGAVFWGGVAFVQYVEPSVWLLGRTDTEQRKWAKMYARRVLMAPVWIFPACAVLLPIVRRLWRSAFDRIRE